MDSMNRRAHHHDRVRHDRKAPGLKFIYVAIILSAMVVSAQIPTGYYDSANGLSGQALANALHEIIDDHLRFPYTDTTTDVWDILAAADEDPSNMNNIVSIYKNESKAKSDHTSGSGWNREHSWPKSLGFPDDGSCNYPYTDTHHLFAADWNYNSARSNKPFDNCDSGCTEWVALNAASSNWTIGSFNTGSWEPWDDVKGDLARAMFYLAVRYNGGTHGGTGCTEPDLQLTNDRNLIVNTSTNASLGYMGVLDVLVAWHNADPVDAYEIDRNQVIYSFQGNRNPFVDHPEWVATIFGGGDGSGGTGQGGGPPPGGGSGGSGLVWINEIHYDNASTDSGEGVEVAAPVGTDLTGWQIVAYNGNGGASYDTVNLSGTISDQQAGIGTLWFAIAGLQNGAPDGLALIDPQGLVSEFLSYEGTFTATNGPANGLTSVDIGVAEDGSTLVGDSLQLGGSGNSGPDFAWEAEQANTMGSPNANQTFTSGGTPPSGGSGGSGLVWINELHYDNAATDAGEGAEVAGPAGTDLTGWSLVAYNGSGGASYATVNLSGTLSDQQGGIGTAWFAISGLQNGAPDGLALVDPQGAVAEFMSWEGSFTGSDGPANGLTSTDIGVSEDGADPAGGSLQLGGSGSSGVDFTWEAVQANTTGSPNTNQTFTGGGTPGGGSGAVWVNEIHYDNASTDSGEGVEVAGPAGTNLTGWQLVAYNGSGGASYATVNLSGTLADQQGGIGTAWFAIAGLQNGAPDGVALIDPQSVVVEFLSWEGVFTASGGAASGLTSTDIGVSETSSTPVGHSLQLGGSGSSGSDFAWQAAQANSAGSPNANQTFTGGGSAPTWSVLDANDFESGWGAYSDGGGDARRSANDSGFAHQGAYCIRLRDNSGTASSFYSTNDADYSSYSEIRIQFWFIGNSMENGEDLLVEFYDGSQWQVAATFISGTDFTNGAFENPEVIIDSASFNFNANNKIRFRCDASANGDQVYIDEVEIAGR